MVRARIPYSGSEGVPGCQASSVCCELAACCIVSCSLDSRIMIRKVPTSSTLVRFQSLNLFDIWFRAITIDAQDACVRLPLIPVFHRRAIIILIFRLQADSRLMRGSLRALHSSILVHPRGSVMVRDRYRSCWGSHARFEVLYRPFSALWARMRQAERGRLGGRRRCTRSSTGYLGVVEFEGRINVDGVRRADKGEVYSKSNGSVGILEF